MVRTSASPSAGSGAGVVTNSVSPGWTSPTGRRRNTIWRFVNSGTMQKLPNANDLFGAILVWEHLWMKSEDDPEARIRELEQPTGRDGTCVRSGKSPSRLVDYSYPPGPAVPPPPPPLTYGSPFPPDIAATVLAQPDVVDLGRCLRHWHDRNPAGVLPSYRTPAFRTAACTTLSPQPRASPPSSADRPSARCYSSTCRRHHRRRPLRRPQHRRVPISTSPASTRTGRSPATTSAVNVSGISNKVVITGHCASLNGVRRPELGHCRRRRHHRSLRLQQPDHLPHRVAEHRQVRRRERRPTGLTR